MYSTMTKELDLRVAQVDSSGKIVALGSFVSEKEAEVIEWHLRHLPPRADGVKLLFLPPGHTDNP